MNNSFNWLNTQLFLCIAEKKMILKESNRNYQNQIQSLKNEAEDLISVAKYSCS